MKLIDFPGRNVVFAEDQPEYLPLPALRLDNAEGEISSRSCWRSKSPMRSSWQRRRCRSNDR